MKATDRKALSSRATLLTQLTIIYMQLYCSEPLSRQKAKRKNMPEI